MNIKTWRDKLVGVSRIHDEQYRVVSENRVRKRLVVAGFGLALVALPVLSFWAATQHYAYDNKRLSEYLESQQVALERLQKEFEDLAQQNANLSLALDVERSSLEQLRSDIVVAREDNIILEEQIRFFQSLMDPDPNQAGIYVDSIDIEPATDERSYRYSVTVAQRAANHKKVNGYLTIELLSESENEQVHSLNINDLTEQQNTLTLGFKFFQQLNGEIILPEAFEPQKVRLLVHLRGQAKPRFEKIFDWSVQS